MSNPEARIPEIEGEAHTAYYFLADDFSAYARIEPPVIFGREELDVVGSDEGLVVEHLATTLVATLVYMYEVEPGSRESDTTLEEVVGQAVARLVRYADAASSFDSFRSLGQ
jgi:hypothetical protein